MPNHSTNPQPQPALHPAIGLSIALLAVSSSALFIRFAQQDGVPSLSIAAYRLTFAVLVLSPWVLIHYRNELRQLTRRELLLACISGIFLALHFATWISSLAFTSVASSTVLVTTSPLITGLLAPIFLREPLTRRLLIGIAIAITGAALIGLWETCQWGGAGLTCDFGSGDNRALLGNGLAFLGALTVSVYLIIGRNLRATLSLNVYVWLVYGAAAIVLMLAALLFQAPLVGFPPVAWVWLLLLALLPQLVGHSLFNWALRYFPAAVISVVTLGEPIFATLLAFLFLSEAPNLGTLIGGLLILAGIFVAVRPPPTPLPPEVKIG